MKRWLFRFSIVCILSIFILISSYSSLRESLTFDEVFNLQEGTTNLTTRTFPIEPYNPPLIRELAVIPSVLGFTPEEGSLNQIIFLNRLVIITFAAILLWQVMITAHEYFGYRASLLSGFLLALEPTFLANSHYVTPDMGLTLFTFLAYKAFLNVLVSPTLTRFFFWGLFFGLACASKISAIPFLLVSIIFVFIFKRKTFPLEWHMDHIGSTIFACVVSLFVIWGTFFFRMTPILVKHDNPERVSNRILAFANEKQLSIIRQSIELLQGLPVPLGDYLGLVKNTMLRSQSQQQPFFMGEFRNGVSWYMIFVTFVTKIPFTFLFFLITGMLLLSLPEKIVKYFINIEDKLRNNDQERETRKKDEEKVMDEYKKVPRYKIRVEYDERMDKEWNYLFIIPIVSIVLVIIGTRMGPLLRYILPVFPFLAIVAGASVQSVRSSWKKILVIALLMIYSLEMYITYPHFISYTNMIIPTEKRFKYFSDSNLDWGQGLISFHDYVKHNQPHQLSFSYFGRDNAETYGFVSSIPWGSYKNNEICEFHPIQYNHYTGPSMTAISISNWYNCGYYKTSAYNEKNIREVVENSILVF